MTMIDLFMSCRRLGAAMLLAAAAMTPAEAQTVVAFVNGDAVGDPTEGRSTEL